MSHGRGRHRRRRQGWASRARRAVGAALAAIVGARPAPPERPAEPGARKPSPRPEPLNPPTSRPTPEPEWVRRYDEARRTHTDRTWSLFTEVSKGTGPDALMEPPKPGWCVDEDGVRAVRPYLVAHEQRQRAGLRRAASPSASPGRPAPIVPAEAAAPGVPGEWDELAGLIRQWDAQRALVV